jgi:hypothetical protein
MNNRDRGLFPPTFSKFSASFRAIFFHRGKHKSLQRHFYRFILVYKPLTMGKDFYEVLGVAKTATQEEIKVSSQRIVNLNAR